jgi:sugar lactone lactonase YvrE
MDVKLHDVALFGLEDARPGDVVVSSDGEVYFCMMSSDDELRREWTTLSGEYPGYGVDEIDIQGPVRKVVRPVIVEMGEE